MPVFSNNFYSNSFLLVYVFFYIVNMFFEQLFSTNCFKKVFTSAILFFRIKMNISLLIYGILSSYGKNFNILTWIDK